MAQERIIIAQLDIDIEGLLRHTQEVISKIDLLKKAREDLLKQTDGLKKATDQERKGFDQLNAKLDALSRAYLANRSVLAENTAGIEGLYQALHTQAKSIKEATEANKLLTEARRHLNATTAEGKAALSAINQKIAENAAFVKEAQKAATASAAATGSLTEALARQTHTINEARASNSELTKIRNTLNATTAEGQAAIEKINQKIAENNAVIKANVSELERQKIGIGAYEESIVKAANRLHIFGAGLGEVYKKTKDFAASTLASAQAQQAASASSSGASRALQGFRLALISTGIGAMVIAISALVAAFLSTQKGIDAVNRLLQPFKATLGGLIGIFQDLATGIVEAFSSGGNLVEKFSKACSNASEVAAQSGKRLKEAFNVGSQIADIEKRLSETEAGFIRRRGEINLQLKEQNQIAEDTTRGLKERQEAAEKTVALAVEERKLVEARGKDEVRLLQLKQSMNKTSNKERAELAEKEKGFNEQIAGSFEKLTTQTNKYNTLVAQADAERQAAIAAQRAAQEKALDEAIAKNQRLLSLYLAQTSGKSSFGQELREAQEVARREAEILKQRAQGRRITEQEAARESLRIKAELLTRQMELTQKNLEDEARLSQLSIDAQLRRGEISAQQARDLRLQGLERQSSAAAALLQEQLDKHFVSEEQYRIRLLELDESYAQQRKAWLEDDPDTLAQKSFEKQLLAEEEAAALAELNASSAELRLQQARDESAEQLAIFAQLLEDKQITQQQFARKSALVSANLANAENHIEFQAQQGRLQGAAGVAGAIAEIAGKESALGKAAAIAQATIDTYAGAAAALKIPPPAGPILAGITIAAGLVNVAQIIGIDTGGVASGAGALASSAKTIADNQLRKPRQITPKLAAGALFQIGGQRHDQGGTQFYGEDGTRFEAEQGELIGVMNRNAAQLFLQFNAAYRGYTPPILPARFEAGGLIEPLGVNPQAIRLIHQQHTDTLASMLDKTLIGAFEAYGQPRVVVQEIDTLNENRVRITDLLSPAP